MVLEPVAYTWEDRSKKQVPAEGYAHADIPGLVVGKDISGYYSVTHAPSGRIASPRFDRLEEAARYMVRLGELCDWREFRPETAMSKALERLVRAMEAEHYAGWDVLETHEALDTAQHDYNKAVVRHDDAKGQLKHELTRYKTAGAS